MTSDMQLISLKLISPSLWFEEITNESPKLEQEADGPSESDAPSDEDPGEEECEAEQG